MNYTSRFPVVHKLSSMNGQHVGNQCKLVFSEDGWPENLISDNGLCYTVEAFTSVMNAYHVNHITSSPHYPQSNGLTEKHVQIVKSLFYMVKQEGNDLFKCLMLYYKFLHNFIICDRLPNTEILFGIDVWKKFALSYALDHKRNCYIQKEGRFHTYTRNCEQKVNVTIVKSILKILLRHNGVIPMMIKGHNIKGHITYFITDQDSKKRRTPTYTSSMAFTTSGKEHMLMFLSQITATNMSPLTKGNM